MRNREPEVEPVILPIRLYQAMEPPPDHHDPDDRDRDEKTNQESFWAGRNHAMRVSARVAA